MLSASKVECVRGDRTLFSGVSFTLTPGASLLIQGANGAGKTSLLRIVLGLARPVWGGVTWHGQPVQSAGESYRREVLYCGHANALKDDLSALENIRATASLMGRPIGRDEALRALALVEVDAAPDLPVRSLSQGEKRRIALTRLALTAAKLWVLDEPLAALDERGVQWLSARLEQHLEAGGMAIVTSHQPLPIHTRVATLRIGQ